MNNFSNDVVSRKLTIDSNSNIIKDSDHDDDDKDNHIVHRFPVAFTF